MSAGPDSLGRGRLTSADRNPAQWPQAASADAGGGKGTGPFYRHKKWTCPLFRPQQKILTGGSPDSSLDMSDLDSMSEQQLALAAREDPSNHRVVEAWFNIVAADAAQVVEFYNEHHSKFKKTAKLYMCLACKLRELERFDDAIRVVAGALKIAEKENRVEEYLPWANQVRLKCLLSDQRLREAEAFVESIKSANGGHDAVAVELFSDMAVECIISNHLQDGERFLRRAYAIADEANLLNDCIEDLASNWYLKAIKAGGTNEDLEFIRGAVARFPESASLHYYCSQMLYRFGPRDLSIREETKVVVNTKERRVARTHSFSDGKPPIECLAHAF